MRYSYLQHLLFEDNEHTLMVIPNIVLYGWWALPFRFSRLKSLSLAFSGGTGKDKKVRGKNNKLKNKTKNMKTTAAKKTVKKPKK